MNQSNLDIKIESVGGMGANLIGKILGETAAMKLGIHASNFSSYGSEKTGSPVTAHVRFRNEHDSILPNTPVEYPDILVLFHHSLLKNTNALAGITTQSSIVVNSPHHASAIRQFLRWESCSIYSLNCQKYITSDSLPINMLMLGAILKSLQDETLLSVFCDFVKDMFASKNPQAMQKNILAIQLGYENTTVSVKNSSKRTVLFQPARHVSEYGYANTPIGGILPSLGNTAENNISLSRNGFIPEFIPEKCIHCGLCDSTCPDMVFTFREGEYNNRRAMINCGPDYRYCKGCLRCVEVCPTQALISKKEDVESLSSSHGADPVITSEAFNSENVMEGGLNE
ncbi:MAG: 2-oxoacid:acceptor oxidoreductase family protein [Thermoflexaceae bacterium]|nr:2-oxoacid:acceptor oxidoreductase family protein [Thermoflexaceae bacterium]